jgi:hypothetical protein
MGVIIDGTHSIAVFEDSGGISVARDLSHEFLFVLVVLPFTVRFILKDSLSLGNLI